nr:daptide biosynthesis RiPP recognition protein [Arthrobacter sp. MA-N2]
MVSEDSALIGKLADHDLKAQDVVLFAPQGNRPPPTVPRWQQFHYLGDFKDPDADIIIGEDFYVQQQSYAVSEFVPIGGPTILRADNDVDRAAFIRDADTAHSSGKFPLALCHPKSLLGDMPTLGFVPDTAVVSNAFIASSGEVFTSPAGLPLGNLEEPNPNWSERWAARMTEVRQRPEVSGRPWISRYLSAADALRHAQVRGFQGMRVSGFGGHLVEELDGLGDKRQTSRLLLLFNGGVAHLHDTASSRTYSLGSDAAKLADIMLTVGSDVSETAARILGCSESLAAASIRQIEESFSDKGIRDGFVEPVGL